MSKVSVVYEMDEDDEEEEFSKNNKISGMM